MREPVVSRRMGGAGLRRGLRANTFLRASQAGLEAAMQSALDASGLTDVEVRLERSDGHVLVMTNGAPNERSSTASTVKPVACAAILDAVATGDLSLDTKVVDVVPEFDALATGEQRNITLGHLLSFTSGLVVAQSTPCWQSESNWGDFVDCTAGLATINEDTNVPGAVHTYATRQHSLAGIMAVIATGKADWATYLADWFTKTSLFGGATWNQSLIHSADREINVTAAEYLAFFKAVVDETILTPALCRDLYADAIPSNPQRTAAYTWVGEDWHFGRGIWLEERSADWTGSPPATRFATIGNAGQYHFFDTALGVRGYVSPDFEPGGDFTVGFDFIRSIDSLINAWAALGGS